jgi:hypothetical protein
MPDMPTSALVVPYRIQRRMSTVSLTPHAEVLLPTGQLLHASGQLSPRGDVPPADNAVWPGQR